MDHLIKMVSEKAGISPEQAQEAVQQVVAFLKEKLPAGMGSQLDNLINSPPGEDGGLLNKLGGMFGGK